MPDKFAFFAVKKAQPIEYDEIEDKHLLEVLENAYKRHGYTVRILRGFDETSEEVKKYLDRLHKSWEGVKMPFRNVHFKGFRL